ncbi:GNAT family protein [uncultured Winogradskyella sp.]|uniref:GNAT family N-acetyltransferase n=1 Tax=uncultured Winogradskyella sp. TaxID=395353 RepID=UPI0030EB4DE3|tara:strand:+ start:608 stop:1207 length:600 start_codon:yes stop_codon:yes gene_type:complete
MTILNFSEDYILENERVRLLPLQISHIKELIKISKEESIWIHFFEKGNNIESLTNYVISAINYRNLKKEYPFVIYDKSKKQFAGCTRLYDYSKELNTIKLGHTWLGKDFQGTKLNKNVKYLLFDFAFNKLQVERIGFGAYSDNKVSIASMLSVGCKNEGVLRNMFPSINGIGRTDAVLMSILKDEWKDSVRVQLKNKLT